MRRTMNPNPFDAITLELIRTRLTSATDEAAELFKRTSFSMLVNESNDLALVITDSTGALIAQSTKSIPSFIGALPVTVKAMIERFGDDLHEDDILATNDPWIASGHLNDITIVVPLFLAGRLVGFAGCCSHAPDIGGRARSLEASQIYEEGIFIPPMKISNAGTANTTFFELYRAATRMPVEAEGDIWGAINALKIIRQRLAQVLADYDLAELDTFAHEINQRNEDAMRRAIGAVPNGVYSHALDTDGLDEALRLQARIVVEDDRMTIDFEGSSPAVPRAINCPRTYTFSMASYAMKCLLAPELPNSEGILRCFKVMAPHNSIVDPEPPAAVSCRAATGQYIPPLIFGALAEALPDRIMATAGSPLWSCVQTGRRDNGETVSNVLFFNGGLGAIPSRDGLSGVSWPSNVANIPVEMVELMSPLLVHCRALAPDSGGIGRRRGGLGLETQFEVDADDSVLLSFIAERIKYPAQGTLGGGAGAPGAILVDGEPVDHRRTLHLRRGQRITVRTPGGAGLGPVEERADADRQRDQRLGYVTGALTR